VRTLCVMANPSHLCRQLIAVQFNAAQQAGLAVVMIEPPDQQGRSQEVAANLLMAQSARQENWRGGSPAGLRSDVLRGIT
jgi:hypothetical protein